MSENTNKHTLANFEEALKHSRKSIITMTSIAQQNLRNAVEGLLQRNESLCNEAIADDEDVNTLERAIDQTGIEILMRFNPVATDLRNVLASMKISTQLERISDESENIARRARKIMKREAVADAQLVQPIYEAASTMLRHALQAYTENNLEMAVALFQEDKELDKIHRKAIKHITASMETNTEQIKVYLHLIFIVRCLERIGDHSLNIGEEVVYIHKGTDIRHIGPSALEVE